MAVPYISIDSTKRPGSALRQAVNYGNAFDQAVPRLKGVMEAMIDGTDYSRLETEFGRATGKGETVYTLVAGAATDTGSTNMTQLLARLG
jgi:hypothetical protein